MTSCTSANGDYLMATATLQPCDLTSWGHTAAESCINHVFQELQPPATPGGTPTVVFSWDTSQYIPVSETGPDGARSTQRLLRPVPRQLDRGHRRRDHRQFPPPRCVYKIDKRQDRSSGSSAFTASRELATRRRRTQRVNGQHDPRSLPTHVTIHDNARTSRPPSTAYVRYAIDTRTRPPPSWSRCETTPSPSPSAALVRSSAATGVRWGGMRSSPRTGRRSESSADRRSSTAIPSCPSHPPNSAPSHTNPPTTSLTRTTRSTTGRHARRAPTRRALRTLAASSARRSATRSSRSGRRSNSATSSAVITPPWNPSVTSLRAESSAAYAGSVASR